MTRVDKNDPRSSSQNTDPLRFLPPKRNTHPGFCKAPQETLNFCFWKAPIYGFAKFPYYLKHVFFIYLYLTPNVA
jgi:hypothetical protein